MVVSRGNWCSHVTCAVSSGGDAVLAIIKALFELVGQFEGSCDKGCGAGDVERGGQIWVLDLSILQRIKFGGFRGSSQYHNGAKSLGAGLNLIWDSFCVCSREENLYKLINQSRDDHLLGMVRRQRFDPATSR